MIGSFKNNRENYPRKCFWTQERKTWVKFKPGLSANRPSNNWAQVILKQQKAAREENARPQKYCFRNVTALAGILRERIVTELF